MTVIPNFFLFRLSYSSWHSISIFHLLHRYLLEVHNLFIYIFAVELDIVLRENHSYANLYGLTVEVVKFIFH